MNFYGWRIKTWKFTPNNIVVKRNEMLAWCEKWQKKYQIREIFINNEWAVEYKLLINR